MHDLPTAVRPALEPDADAVHAPDGAEWAPRPRVDNAMVKALARAFRWRKMLDEGACGTIEDRAKAKGVVPSYVSRVLMLTLLAPEIVERSLMDGNRRGCSSMISLRGSRWSGMGSAPCRQTATDDQLASLRAAARYKESIRFEVVAKSPPSRDGQHAPPVGATNIRRDVRAAR